MLLAIRKLCICFVFITFILVGCNKRNEVQEIQQSGNDSITAVDTDENKASNTNDKTIMEELINNTLYQELPQLTGDKEISAEADRMSPVAEALIRSSSQTGVLYNSGDQEYVWLCLYNLINMVNKNVDRDYIYISEIQLQHYMNVMFKGMLELPPITEKVSSFVTFLGKEKGYRFTYSDLDYEKVQITNIEKLEDGHFKLTAKLFDGDEVAGVWNLYASSNEAEGEEGYPYVIEYMETMDYMCNDIYEEINEESFKYEYGN